MGILAANLKHLYQRRWLWLLYCFVAPLTLALVLDPGRQTGRETVLLVVLILGAILGNCQRETLSRPFSFLMPRHTETVPRQSLIQGLLFGCLVPLAWLTSPSATLFQSLAVFGTAWMLGIACYMAGTVLGFVLPFVTPFIGLIPLAILGSSLLAVPEMVEIAIVERPVLTLPLALGAIVWSCRYLGRRCLARRWTGGPSLGFFDEFNMAKAQQYHKLRKARKASCQDLPDTRPLARFCIAGIRSSRPDGVLRYCHATCCEWFGAISLKQALNILAVFVAAILFMGYIAGGKNSVICFLMPAAMVGNLRRIHAATFLPVGRRQRCILALVAVLSLTALVTCMAWLGVLLSHAVAPVMPPLPFGPATLSFRPFPYLYALIPAALTPLALAAVTWLRRRTLAVALLLAPVFPLAMFLAMRPGGLPLAVCLVPIPATLLLSLWAVRHHCLRRDLV